MPGGRPEEQRVATVGGYREPPVPGRADQQARLAVQVGHIADVRVSGQQVAERLDDLWAARHQVGTAEQFSGADGEQLGAARAGAHERHQPRLARTARGPGLSCVLF